MLVQKSENVLGPDVGSKVAKGVAVAWGVAVGGINLQLYVLPTSFIFAESVLLGDRSKSLAA
jgi:hypothetical protein